MTRAGGQELLLIEMFLGLLLLMAALSWAAPRLHVPYTVLLVGAGVIAASLPQIPRIELDPDAVFLIFVPPIVYFAAFFSSWWPSC
jgi:NhaP-type Na+/H+ or K+/H+ antiporter